MQHQIKVLQGVVGMLLSEGNGVNGTAFPNQPKQLLKLYEFEACPYCRRVRQVLTLLNLDYEVYPCPRKGKIYRDEALKISGKSQFPLLVDPNTNMHLLESQEIIDYLFATYGEQGKTPSKWRHLPEKENKGTLMTVVSMLRGLNADKINKKRLNQGKQPEQLLELYGFEASPYAKIVRERLCELEIPFICRNVAKERWQDQGHYKIRLKPGKYKPMLGGKRDYIFHEVMQGHMQLPFLKDPNTEVALFESKNILQYLNKTYAK